MARNLILLSVATVLATTAFAAPARGATGPITKLEDLIVPEIFTSYVQNLTAQKSNLVRSGALVEDATLNGFLSGAGSTFTVPGFKDLDNDEENTSSDHADDSYTGGATNSKPKKIGTLSEIAVRLSRNQSWSSADLANDLIGADPMNAVANRVADYWTRRLQTAFVSTMRGVFAMNSAAPVNGSTHAANDMTHNISSTAFTNGVTNFSGSALIDAAVTMGDSMEDLTMICVHSIVYARMQKNNLIEFIPDARGEVRIPTYLNRVVIVDDGMPATGGVFESWLFGANTVGLGTGSPAVPTEVERKPNSGNGGGSSVLFNRVEWLIHPRGHAFIGTPASAGGPTNAATAGNLAAAASWRRAVPERKQVKIARLITREF
jgi:hypothetical protein